MFILFFLVLAKWNIYHTHISPSNKSLFLHKPPSVESTPHSPLLFHQQDVTEKYKFRNFSGSIYWHLCVPLSHFSVSWPSEMQFGVIYLKTWGGTKPYMPFSMPEFCSCLFLAEHTWHWIHLHCVCQCLFWLVSSLFSWLVDETCLPCLVVKKLSGEVHRCRVALFVVTHSDPL